jgi:iron complex transport system ATP-binding protein
MVVVEVDGVTARYSGSRAECPLSDASLCASSGEILSILGPNGAGKSTLLRVIAGTLPAERGHVRLFGADQAAMTRRDLARSVAFVPQLGEVAFGFSVLDVVLMGRAPHQGTWMTPAEADMRIAREAIARCDLEGLEERRVPELSGGEQKRVGIARALAQQPKLLLLDEPSAFLDVRHQIALYDLLAELAATSQIAVVCVMHDLNVAAQYSSRVVLMNAGRILAEGTVEEVMTYRRLQETFDADLYCGVNDLSGARFFLPMRGKEGGPRNKPATSP